MSLNTFERREEFEHPIQDYNITCFLEQLNELISIRFNTLAHLLAVPILSTSTIFL